ncbi:MAG: outer membrane beta-barrel protein [Bacteroidales bacterium]|nr:outer membrane beta-barrel protein [Bacteroidales bacterium]
MYKKLLVLFFAAACTLTSVAQHSIQGKVLDKNDEGVIEMAAIRLLNKADSSLVQGVLTNARGAFTLTKVKAGAYLVEVRFLGYETTFTPVEVADKAVLMKNIYLTQKAKELSAVEVTGMAAQMVVRGDTIEFNPAAFKLAENAVVEDLLKKLPGVTVDNEGKITVNGEEIKRIRVDGKKFFDGDMQMTTKNMPADIVDKVQVIDLKSETAQLTGFEDENTERIINLTIKDNRRKGTFGNVSVGGGLDRDLIGRYDANAFINLWNNDVRTTVTGGANNTNSARSGRGRGGMSFGGGGGSGYIQTQNIGINNNTQINDSLVIGGDGSYNHTSSSSDTESERENWLGGTTYLTKSTSSSDRSNHDAGLRFEMEWKPDTTNTLILQPRLNYGISNSRSNSSSDYTSIVGEDSTAISESSSRNESQSQNGSASLNLIYNRRSPVKKGRNLSINVSGNINTSESQGQNYSEKLQVITDSLSVIDQHNTNESQSFSTNARVSYIEPLFNLKNFLEVAASFNANTQTSEKLQYNKNDLTKVYDVLDSTYSNQYKNLYLNQSLDLSFRHQDTNYSYQLGVRAEPFQITSINDYMDGDDLRRTNSGINYSPSAMFQFNFTRRTYARLRYRGRSSQPSIEQMQPVKNNDNLMREPIGNPDLRPSFNQSLEFLYTNFNQERLSSYTLSLNGSFTQNALVSNQIYDQTGKVWSQTVNAKDIPFNGNTRFSFNTPIIKNRLQFNTNTNLNFRQSYSYSDRSLSPNPFVDANQEILRLGNLGTTASWGGNETLGLTLTTDILEVGARGSVAYSASENSLNNYDRRETWDWTGGGNVNLHLPYNLNIANDLSYTARSGYSEFTKNELIWNASIDKTVFNSMGVVTLRLYDILRQRQNLNESINDNSRQLSRYNTLTSYFMISFTYRLMKFANSNAGMGGMMRGTRGGGGRGGFGGGGGGGFGGGGGGGFGGDM